MSERPKKARPSVSPAGENANDGEPKLPSIRNALAFAGLIGLGITNPSASVQGLVSLLEATSNDAVNLSYLTAGLKILAVAGEKSGFSWISGPTGIALEIVGMVERAQTNKGACRTVAIRVFRTIQAISQRVSPNIEQPVRELERELRKVLEIVRNLSSQNKFRQTIHGEDIEKRVLECDKLLDQCIALFSLKAHVGHAADIEQVKTEIGHVKTIVQKLNLENRMTVLPKANLQISSTAPAPPAIFVGRDDLVSEGVNHLITAPGTHSAILGHGGIGKTSLSLAIFHQSAVKKYFSDQCFFVPCESLENGLDLVQAMLQILGVSTLSDAQDPRTALSQQLNSLDKCLLLLDNFETLSNDTASISILEMVSSILSVSLLVNMRGEFPPPSVIWGLILPANGLGPLELNFAKEIYLKRQSNPVAMDKQSTFLLDDLLNEVGCVPLAVFILSELGKRYSIEVLQQRWAQSKTMLLKMPGGPTSKITDVAISIDLSLQSDLIMNHLEASRLLHILALLPEGLSNWPKLLPLITPGFDNVYDALDIACQTALLQRTDHLLSMLNPTRQYLLKSKEYKHAITQKDIKAIFDLFNDYVQQCSEVLASFGKANIACLFEAYMNFVQDLSETVIQKGIHWAEYLYDHHLLTLNLIDVLLKRIKLSNFNTFLAQCYMHKGKILFALNEWQDAIVEYGSAYEAYSINGNKFGMAKSLILIGNNFRMQTQYVKAIEKHTTAYVIFSELGDQAEIAHSLLLLGNDLRMQDKYEEAVEKHSTAYIIYKEINDQLGIADSLKSLGDDFILQHQYAEASSKLEEAHNVYLNAQNKSGIAHSLESLGNVFKMQAKYELAIQKHYNAFEVFQSMNKDLGVANSLVSIGDILRLQGKYTEAFAKLNEATYIFTKLKYQPGKANCLKAYGNIFMMQNQHSEAIQKLEASYDIFSKIEDQLGMAQSLDLIGDCLMMKDKYEEAVKKHNTAYSIYQQIQDKNGMAKSLKSLGNNLRIQGKYSEAFIKDHAAFEIYNGINYQPGIADSLQALGNDLRYQSKYKEAIQRYQDAYNIWKEIDDILGTANTLDCLGDAYRMTNNLSKAIKSHESAFILYSKLQNQSGIAKSLRSLGDNFKIQQKYDEAIEKHTEALKIYELLQDDLGMANSLKSLGDDFKSQNKYSQAIEKLTAAFEIFQKVQDPLGMANSQNSLGEIYGIQGNYSIASEKHAKAIEIYGQIGYKLGMAHALMSVGKNLNREGKYDEAIAKHEEAYIIYEEIEDKSGMANSLKALRDNLRMQGNDSEANEKQSAAYTIYAEILRESGIEPIDSLGNDLIVQHLL